jgi:hypothetical protein
MYASNCVPKASLNNVKVTIHNGDLFLQALHKTSVAFQMAITNYWSDLVVEIPHLFCLAIVLAVLTEVNKSGPKP